MRSRAREHSYRELIARIDAFAGALADRGIGVGDVVGLLAPNSTAFAIAFHGILRAGATATTINVLFTAKDIVKQLTDSKAKMLVTVSPLLPQAKEAAAAVGLSDDQTGGARRPGRSSGHPNAADLLDSGRRRPGGELRPGDTPGRAALQLGHDGQSQGRDADPSQPGRQRRPDPPGAGRAARRRRHRDHAVLPHLRNDGVAQRRPACAGAPGDDAQLRSRGVPRQHPEPQGHRRLYRAAGGGRAGQTSVGEQLRPVVAARDSVRRGTAG